uniref:Uncharacterized protein n=1 Tax=Arundo donax TaxID=35708 RepID=A0A0A9BKU0_ARUDO
MGSKVCVSLLALLIAALALAGGVAAGLAADVSGSAQQLISSRASMPRVEVHRRILGSIKPSSLNPDRPSCIKSCPASGRPYTGRNCQKVYQCAG